MINDKSFMNDNLSNLTDEQLSYLFSDDNADLSVIRACGERGAAFGIKCLTIVARYGHLDIVQYLVEKKKVLEFTRYEMDRHRSYDKNGTAPLIEAAQHGHAEIVGYLLEKYPYLKDIRDDDNALPLHHAVESASLGRRRYDHRFPSNGSAESYEECLRLLSDNWDYVNAESDNGTPLCFAAAHGNLSAICLLLDNKADVNGGKYTSDGTPILQGNDEDETIMALMDNQDVVWMATNEKGETLFHNFRPETAKLVDFYLKKLKALDNETAQLRSCEGTTLLHALVNAIGNEDLDMDSRKKLRNFIPELIAKGIDVNALSWADDKRNKRNNCSGTAAHCAARNNDLETLKDLLKCDVDLTKVDCNGNNLFIAAADTSRKLSRSSVADMKAVFDFLETQGVDISQANVQGQNVLFYLCEPEKRYVFDYVLELAKRKKAEDDMLKKSDQYRMNLLWYAVKARNLPLLKDLAKNGLTVDETLVNLSFIIAVLLAGSREKDTKDWQKFIKDNHNNLKCSQNLPDNSCSTVLEWTVSYFNDDPCDVDGIKMLIDELKIDPTKENQKSGEGIFHWLAKAYAFSSELAEYLFEKAPDLLEKPNTAGQFPIHIAARKGNLDFIKWVVGKKQDYDILAPKDKEGNTVLSAYLTGSAPRCNDLKWFYDEAHRHNKYFFDKEKTLCNGVTPLEMYFREAADEADPQVVGLLCQWCVEENKSLDNAISDWSTAGKASPACIQAYLEACERNAGSKPNWKALFDNALLNGNSELALFIMDVGFNPLDIKGATLAELWEKAVQGNDGNYIFFRTLFDKYKWPKSILNVKEQSALYWLLKDNYSDEKLPLFKFLWTYTDYAGVDFVLAFPNSGAAQTIAWILNRDQITMQDLSSPLAQSLLKEIKNPTELEKWLNSFDEKQSNNLVLAAIEIENHGMLRYILDYYKEVSITLPMLESAVNKDDVIALALLLAKNKPEQIDDEIKQTLLKKASEQKSGDIDRFLNEVCGITRDEKKIKEDSTDSPKPRTSTHISSVSECEINRKRKKTTKK